jgi:hypothetical protein
VAQNVIATTASTKRNEWNLDGTWLDNELLPKKAAWETAWGNYENPMTRTKEITFIKQKRREEYEAPLRKLVKILQSSLYVADSDLEAMGIAIQSSERHPAPVPTTVPKSRVVLPSPAVVEIHFSDSESEHRAKPVGVHGVEAAWALLEEPTNDWRLLTHSTFDTHTPLRLTFEGPDRGRTLYFALRWENTRGEKGPWSAIEYTSIP